MSDKNQPSQEDQSPRPRPQDSERRYEYRCPTHGTTIAKGGQCGHCVQGDELTKKIVDDNDLRKAF